MFEYDDKTLKHLQEVQLMILKDFIKICEKNNLEYYAYGGTALGAIRHNGFIPWDDDVDILMFREDYEKFLKIMDESKSDKYEILNIDQTEDYLYMFSKLCLKETKFKSTWCLKKPFNVGIHIDIFVFDYIPSKKLIWFIFHKKFILLRKLGYLLDIIQNDYYISNFKEKIGHTLKFIFNMLGITNTTFKKSYKKTLDKLHEKSDRNSAIYDIAAIGYDKSFPKQVIHPPKKVKFESIEINVPNDYDTYLKTNYGNYMEFPPKEKRINHSPNVLDFGEY